MFSKKYDFIIEASRRQCLMTGWQIYAQRENFSPAKLFFWAIRLSAGEHREQKFPSFAIIDAEMHAQLAFAANEKEKRAHERAEMFRKKNN